MSLLTLLGLNIWGLMIIVESISSNKKNNAIVILTEKVNSMYANIGASTAPCTAMNAVIQLNSDWTYVNETFFYLAPILLVNATSKAILTFVLAPNTIVQSIFPPDLPAWQVVYGLDLLKNQTWRPDALKTIGLRHGMVLTGPVRLRAGLIGLVARFPVWINNVSNLTTFGSSGILYNCDICYVDNSKFWGFVQMNIDWNYLINNITNLYSICDNKLNFKMTYIDPVSTLNTTIASCGKLNQPIFQDIVIMHNKWVIEISDSVRWYPTWFEGALVIIIVMSLLVSISLFIMLVKRRQHIWLLESMLPRKVVTKLQRGHKYAENFDNVTIMFSDIVSYTTMTSTMTPLEVAQLLNEIYQLFDSLVDKYECYKVETIGDAFMIAAGINGESKVEAAVKVANFAQHVLKQIESFTSSLGHKIQIRIGIHSGPVVGSVIGYKMPHFCLCGDTVNTASRMESNSLPMKIHISKDTADLLQDTFTIIERGNIEIKGKGIMTTFWLEPSVCISEVNSTKKVIDLRVFRT
jgi:class 3 adenylate cyclase